MVTIDNNYDNKCSIYGCDNNIQIVNVKCHECSKKICHNCAVNLLHCNCNNYSRIKCPMCNTWNELQNDDVIEIMLNSNILIKKVLTCCDDKKIFSIEEYLDEDINEIETELIIYTEDM